MVDVQSVNSFLPVLHERQLCRTCLGVQPGLNHWSDCCKCCPGLIEYIGLSYIIGFRKMVPLVTGLFHVTHRWMSDWYPSYRPAPKGSVWLTSCPASSLKRSLRYLASASFNFQSCYKCPPLRRTQSWVFWLPVPPLFTRSCRCFTTAVFPAQISRSCQSQSYPRTTRNSPDSVDPTKSYVTVSLWMTLQAGHARPWVQLVCWKQLPSLLLFFCRSYTEDTIWTRPVQLSWVDYEEDDNIDEDIVRCLCIVLDTLHIYHVPISSDRSQSKAVSGCMPASSSPTPLSVLNLSAHWPPNHPYRNYQT